MTYIATHSKFEHFIVVFAYDQICEGGCLIVSPLLTLE